MKSLLKKVASIVACAALVCCVWGCSQETGKEEWTNQAIEITASDIHSEVLGNEAKASQDWDGKIVKYTGQYYRVFNGKAEMFQEKRDGYPLDSINVELSEDELATLEPNNTYTVIGKIRIISAGFTIDDAFLVTE